MSGWEVAALGAGALFTSGVLYVTLVRVPRWQSMETSTFLRDFARSINIADKVQPTFLVATIFSAAMLSASMDGTESWFAGAAAAGFLVTLLASLGILVPLQRHMIGIGDDPTVPMVAMRSKWVKGHFGRTALTVLSFTLLVIAALGIG